MQIETSRFGTLEIDESGIVCFPDGLPGFETHQKFVFIPHRLADPQKTSPFVWLQSMSDAKLAFLMTDPRTFFPDYQPAISSADRQTLGIAENDANARIYALLTVPAGNPSGITANLMAPIVVNGERSIARQVVINDDRYGLRHRLVAGPSAPAPQPGTMPRSLADSEEFVVHR